ncbi:MAG: lipopolysaccharide transport periplasmic protein LptA [Acidiferrobacterales bacterium]
MRLPSIVAVALVLVGSALYLGESPAARAGSQPPSRGAGHAAVAAAAATHRAGGIASERSLPIQISADRIEIDQKNGMAYYRGHVTFVQGGLRITAAKAQASMHNNAVQTISAQGNPITFFQRMPAPQEDIRGSALRLKYYASERRLDLYEMVRFRQGNDTLRSARLHYDIATGTLTAVAGSAQDRVHVVIQPQEASAPTNSGPVQPGKRP